MRTVLICHSNDPMNAEGLARWLASFSELAGIVELREPPSRLWRRLKREMRRVGLLRLLDVFAFRLYSRAFLRAEEREFERGRLQELQAAYPPIPSSTRRLVTPSANTPEVEAFVRELAPTLMIARCKCLLKESIFSLPERGTLVMHPGICPEYRNAHGCFWALARNDLGKVGMTLLRIDRGVDTGPVYGYYGCDSAASLRSHVIVQHRVVFDNLPRLRAKLEEIAGGRATPLDTSGRESAAWGQPWLTAYWAWQRRARAGANRPRVEGVCR